MGLSKQAQKLLAELKVDGSLVDSDWKQRYGLGVAKELTDAKLAVHIPAADGHSPCLRIKE